MKARVTYLSEDTNPGKILALDLLHREYVAYVLLCIELLVKDKRFGIKRSEYRKYFPPASALSSQIVKNAQHQAVGVVDTWIKGIYGRSLKKHINKEDLDSKQKLELRCIGKYRIKKAGPFGKATISQLMLDLYWSWVWTPEVSGKPPVITEDFPMEMSEMTCGFGPSEEAKTKCWWVCFSGLERYKRVAVPLDDNPYLKDRKDLANTVSVKKRNGRWSIQFVEKTEAPVFESGEGKLGVDVGLNVIAATSDGRLFGANFKEKFNKTYDKRNKLKANRQRQCLKKDSKRLKRMEQKLSGMIKTEMGRVSNLSKYRFVIEDLDLRGSKGQKRFAYRALQKALTSKAVVEVVNPAYTSQTCPSCGNTNPNNRNGIKFICTSCGLIAHADVVGGRNLLGRSEDKQIASAKNLSAMKAVLETRYLQRRSSVLNQSVSTALEPSSRRLTVEKLQHSLKSRSVLNG